MSADTLRGVVVTCRGLVGLANHLLSHHGDVIKYVLLGKIQSDKLESRFGHLQKLAGSNYWATVRQFMEGKAVVRAISLVHLSGYSLGTVAQDMESAHRQRQAGDDQIVDSLVKNASLDGPLELGDGAEQAIGHLAGYLARSALRKHKCDACHAQLVCDMGATTKVTAVNIEEDEEARQSTEVRKSLRSFCELLNRGKLIFPSDTALLLTKKCVPHLQRNHEK